MQNATLPAEEMAKEKTGDFARDGHEPGRTGPTFQPAVVFVKRPTHGVQTGLRSSAYPDIFNELKQEDIFDYYRERYAPNNVFFCGRRRCREPTTWGWRKSARLTRSRGRGRFRRWCCRKSRNKPRRGTRWKKRRSNWGTVQYELAHSRVTASGRADSGCAWRRCSAAGGVSRLYQELREKKKGLVNSVDAWDLQARGNPGLMGHQRAGGCGQIHGGTGRGTGGGGNG